jgi:hypothetical protein
VNQQDRHLAEVRKVIASLKFGLFPTGRLGILKDDGSTLDSTTPAFHSIVVAALKRGASRKSINDAIAIELSGKDLPTIDYPPEEKPKASTDPRPEIRLTTELHQAVSASSDALGKAPNIYQRDNVLVHVVRATPKDQEASTTIDADGKPHPRILEGTPLVRTLALSTLTETLTEHAVFTKWNDRANEWRPAQPYKLLVETLSHRGQWPGVRELVGVIDTPSIRPDGSLLDVPGYDAATRFLYAPTCEFPSIPDKPTQADAVHALADLCEPFAEFPWANEASRYVPVALALALVGRPGIRGASIPCFIVDAATPGTGKTFAADAACIIGTGRGAPRGTFPGTCWKGEWQARPEELEKILSSHALQSARLVGFDNVPVGLGFGGAPLDKCLTAHDTVTLRVLGKTKAPEIIWRSIVVVTGNNLEVVGDTIRRSLVGRMVSALERPEERNGFRIHPLLPWVEANRARLVAAALTILRAHAVAGRPDMGVTSTDSFAAFVSVVVSAILFAGGPNVLDARPAPGATDGGERGAVSVILEWWPVLTRQLEAPDGVTLRTAMNFLYPSTNPREAREPDGFNDLRGALEQLATPAPGRAPDVKALGNQLRRYLDRVVGGRTLVSRNDRKGFARWRVEGDGR